MKKLLFIFTCLLISNLGKAQDLEDKLIFYSKLDYGTSTEDLSLNSDTSNVVGTIAATDRFSNTGGATSFGGSDYIVYDHGAALDLSTEDFTVSTWFKTSNTSRMSLMMVGRYDGGSANQRIGIELNHPSGNIYSYINGSTTSSTEVVSSSALVADNNWHHLVFIRKTDDLFLYLDGILVGSNTTATSRNISNPGFRKVHLGCLYNTSGPQIFYTGEMDETAIYMTALSDSSVKEIYEKTTPYEAINLSSGLISEIDFSASSTYDSLGHAVLFNNSSVPTTDRNSNTNEAASFDGATTDLEFDTDNEYNLNNSNKGHLSVSLWFKTNTPAVRQGLISIGRYMGGTSSNGRLTIELNSPTGDSIKIVQADDANNVTSVAADATISDDVWHHLVYVRKNNVNRLFLDGVEIINARVTSLNLNGNKKLYIGSLYTTLITNRFNGSMDDIYIYERGLHLPEIQSLYNNGDFKYESNFESELVFDVDFNGDSLDRTNYNTPIVNSNTTLATGFIPASDAYEFNNGYMRYKDSSVMDLGTSKFTVSLWMKSTNSVDRQILLRVGRYNNGSTIGHGKVNLEINTPTGEDISTVLSDDANTSTSLKKNTAVNLTDGEWHHIAFVRSGVSQTLYIDGEIETRQNRTLLNINNTLHRYTLLGAGGDPVGVYFDGSLDDVKIFKRALNLFDIQNIYAQKVPCVSTYATINPSTCGSNYTSPSGKIFTATGNYMDTISNSIGCDSVITINLTVTNINTGVSLAGNTLTSNQAGAAYRWLDCNNSNSFITGETAQSFTATTSGNYAVEVTNNGCIDTSLCTYVLVCGNTTSILNPISCGDYTSPSGKIFTATGNYMDTIPNNIGCDSVITINLTVTTTYATLNTLSCGDYTSPSGKTFSSSGNYTDTILNSLNCDSIITINLTVNNINTIVTSTSNTITANESSATYRWLDCNNGYSFITGETAQSLAVTTTGSYSVELTNNGCVDTSLCVNITINTTGINNVENNDISIYPNPTTGKIYLLNSVPSSTIKIMDVSGKVLKSYNQNESELDISFLPKGVYFIKVDLGNKMVTKRIVKL